MITSSNEYLSKLHLIQNNNKLQSTVGNLPPIPIPESELLLKVDLNTRKIEAPDFLGVEADQKAETFFFEIDRFYGPVDLTLTSCIIQYKTPTGAYLYPVPFYDTVTNDFVIIDFEKENEEYKVGKYYIKNIEKNTYELTDDPYNKELIYFKKLENGKMLIPWQINYNATKQSGNIQYNMRFFSVNTDTQDFDFNLSTLTATSKILPTLTATNLGLEEDAEIQEATTLDALLDKVNRIDREYELYWTELD